MLLLGIDIGSSSVKASVVDGTTGRCLCSAFSPQQEMEIKSPQPGWAEQDPALWWHHACEAVRQATADASVASEQIGAIGITYQMHGLVLVDKSKKVLRPAIIWCDSRAVPVGNAALEAIGTEKCLSHLLNSPGNFTASKLAWVKQHEPDIFQQVYKIMLPGDYMAMKLTGEICTTPSGLSEGIFWDFTTDAPADFLLDHFGFSKDVIPEVVPSFADQGKLTDEAASALGLRSGIPVTYRAGDQPNNALSLDVLEPGEVAATAGTSGVVYGVSDTVKYDPPSRVNTFLHVNHTPKKPRLGVLLCINGTGILNSWLRRNVAEGLSYEEMNALAQAVPPGSDGLCLLPFGNGAERMLENRDMGAAMTHINFNTHTRGHVLRAAQEGIVFSFWYGLQVMHGLGITPSVIRAGNANMFLSPIFRETLANISGVPIDLYDTDGAQGAARAAGVGAGYYADMKEAMKGLKKIHTIEPDKAIGADLEKAYRKWEKQLLTMFNR